MAGHTGSSILTDMDNTESNHNFHKKARELTDRRALPNDYMLGNYRIMGLLGRGNFAFTYLASASGANGEPLHFAIKELFPEGVVRDHATGQVEIASRSEDSFFEFALERFAREARVLTECEHSNVVRIVDGFKCNGTAYIVMPYLAGQPLDSVCETLGLGKHMEESQIRQYIDPILDGLGYLHARGITHRDLKPDNIYILDSGRPLLLDFGVAKQENHLNRLMKKVPSLYVEAQGYSPWEQVTPGGEIGPWTDLYALGAVIHYLINPKGDRSGRNAVPPRSADRGFTMYAKERSPDPYQPLASQRHLLSLYPMALLEAVDWALEWDFRERPQTVRDWQAAMIGSVSRRKKPGPVEVTPTGVNPPRPSPPQPGPDPNNATQIIQPEPPPLPAIVRLLVLIGFFAVCFGLAFLLKGIWE